MQNNGSNRTLHGFWLSPYMATVAHCMEEAGLPYQYERVSPYKGQTLASTHRQRNALGKIPTLVDSDGQVISESLAICRTLARKYPEAARLYPCHDPIRCAEVDRLTDFITFSISGPYFNAFVFGAYFPQAFGLKTEKESALFTGCSVFLVKGAIGRLLQAAECSPFLLGSEPCLPDIQLFQILQLGKTFAVFFKLPHLDLTRGDEALEAYYQTMAARPATQAILARQEEEREMTRAEIFGDFATSYAKALGKIREFLPMIVGHPV